MKELQQQYREAVDTAFSALCEARRIACEGDFAEVQEALRDMSIELSRMREAAPAAPYVRR